MGREGFEPSLYGLKDRGSTVKLPAREQEVMNILHHYR
jgi:hypothetical protein